MHNGSRYFLTDFCMMYKRRQKMIETVLVYLAGGALAIALFFVLVARIVRLITGRDLLLSLIHI